MALAFARVGTPRPDLREVVTDVTLDGSYAAGGYAITPAELGMLGAPDAVECVSYRHATATSSNLAVWDPVNSKLKVFETGGAVSGPFAECIAGDITTAHVVRLKATGNPRT
jgi:hypothetical protein